MTIRTHICLVASLFLATATFTACSTSGGSYGSTYYRSGYYGSGFSDSYYYDDIDINIDNRPNRPDRPDRPSHPIARPLPAPIPGGGMHMRPSIGGGGGMHIPSGGGLRQR